MNNGKLLIFCFSFIAVISLFSNAAYAGLSASPATINFNNVLRGGYAEQYIVIANIGDERVQISMGPEGPPAGWIQLSESNFILEANQKKIVKLSISPPLDTPNGMYKGVLYTTSAPISPTGVQQTGVLMTWGVDILLSANVTDQQIINYTVLASSVSNAEECKMIQFTTTVFNTGNVRVSPKYHFEVLDYFNKTVVKSYDYQAEVLLPTQVRTDSIKIPYELAQFRCIPQGQFTLMFKAYLEDRTVYTREQYFEILPPGSLSILGNLKGISHPENVSLGEVVKIDGRFSNVGDESLISKMKCEIYREDNKSLIEFVESSQLEVGIGKEQTLTAYYTPKEPGVQTVKCLVNYENKATPPVTGKLNVTVPLMFIYIGILLLIIIVIIIAWRLTRKKAVVK